MIEVWKDIPGYEGRYQASTLGRIKSLARTVRIGRYFRNISELILKPKPSHYPQIQIGGNMHLIHRLVAIAFIPNPKNCREVNHIDCDRKNNKVDNLEWCTPSENMRHAHRNGRMIIYRGEDHYTKKRRRIPGTKRWEAV